MALLYQGSVNNFSHEEYKVYMRAIVAYEKSEQEASEISPPYPKKFTSPDQVRPDNSDLYRYDTELAAALHKERFKKARPDEFSRFCEASGVTGLDDPFEAFDFQLDLEKFITALDDVKDRVIFQMFLLGRVKQTEIAEVVGCCQATVHNRLRKLFARFAEFYAD